MSWNNCKKCVLISRSNFNSALFKVLLTLKLLHGGRTGAKGSSLEDIAMHMIKHFALDGDIKSQVLATLKYGVKMHFIHKRKEKFSLIMPASSVQLAPCKFKTEEIERINCIFPAAWQSNSCNDESCGGDMSCCGKRKRAIPAPCCHDDNDDQEEDPCNTCGAKRSKPVCKVKSCSRTSMPKSSCSECSPPVKKPRRGRAPCPQGQLPPCARKKRRGPPKPLYDDYCQMCSYSDDENDTAANYDAYKNCACCSK